MNAGTRRAGFTLLEMLAVIVIIGVVSLWVLPNLGFTASENLRDDARELAGALELARQRTVMTGIPHRITIDLDASTWLVEVEREVADLEPSVALPGSSTIDLSPPADAQRVFEPMGGDYGHLTSLRRGAYFAEIATEQAVIESGQVTVGFDRDGSAEPTEILLEEPGGAAFVLELRPLADAVRVRDA